MSKFLTYNVQELLGLTRIAQITDEQIWNELVTPQVKALLGDIQGPGTVKVVETVPGDFPGDEVSNLNDHRLYGGKNGFVRFPYIQSTYRTKYGLFVVKRDGLKFKAFGWSGKKGKFELIFKAALRDRRYDGTPRADDCSLLDFPFKDPQLNAPLALPGMTEDMTSVELSIYGFMPGSRVLSACGDAEFDEFIRSPFSFLNRPEKFLELFKRAWSTDRAPGQYMNPIPDVSAIVAPVFEKLAREAGYDFIENASSHYHVAMWAQSIGYRYRDAANAETLAQLAAGIRRLKDGGMTLTRAQESWVCVVQSLRASGLCPPELDLGGPLWPQDNVGDANLWMYKPLNERASRLLSG